MNTKDESDASFVGFKICFCEIELFTYLLTIVNEIAIFVKRRPRSVDRFGRRE